MLLRLATVLPRHFEQYLDNVIWSQRARHGGG
jgi:hypothetical protein